MRATEIQVAIFAEISGFLGHLQEMYTPLTIPNGSSEDSIFQHHYTIFQYKNQYRSFVEMYFHQKNHWLLSAARIAYPKT